MTEEHDGSDDSKTEPAAGPEASRPRPTPPPLRRRAATEGRLADPVSITAPGDAPPPAPGPVVDHLPEPPAGALASKPSPRFALRLLLGAAVLVVALVGVVLTRKPPPTKASPIGARLELAAGDVRVKQGADWAFVGSGLAMTAGAGIEAGKGARALVRLSDGSGVLMRGGTKATLLADGVEIADGEVWLDAPGSDRGTLAHKAGDVTVSAADAGLSIGKSGGDVTIYVARGLAIVTAPGGRVEVSAGERAVVAGAAAPKVAPVAFWDDWTGGMGDQRAALGVPVGAGRIYGVNPSAPGVPARTLELARMSVRATLRDGLAETEVDQTFSNPGGGKLEGWYWFTLPERAIVTSFAVETDGVLVEGEVIERQDAATQYRRAVSAGHEPALLEWIDGKSYRARIYPVPASGSRRVVLRYLEMSPARGGKLSYVYPLRAPDAPEIGELSLEVDLGADGALARITTQADAVVEEGGRRVTMRRSGYRPRADFQLEAELGSRATAPLRVARFSGGGDRADYVMARLSPDVDWAGLAEQPGNVVIAVDTSASADESARQIKTAAVEAALRAMSKDDRFALIAVDASATVLYPKDGLAEASDKEIASALERLAEHSSGGATDLGASFDVALARLHAAEQPAVVYVGDGTPTSGEVSGDKLVERLRRSLSVSRARFFTVAVGADANHALLHELARAGGGQAFRVDGPDETTAEVLRLASAIKTPTLTDLTIDLGAGLDEVLVTASGKLSRGEEAVLLARTHHPLPTTAKVSGRIAGKAWSRDYPIEIDRGVGASLVPRLWAAEKVSRLLGESDDPDEHRGRIVELGVEYGLMTPYTSILALESEVAYQQQGIQRRRSPLRGVKLTGLSPAAERDLAPTLTPPPEIAVGCSKSSTAEPEATEPAPARVADQEPRPGQAKGGVGSRERGESAPVAAATAAAAAAAEPPGPAVDEQAAENRPNAAAPPAMIAPGRPAPVQVGAQAPDGFGRGASAKLAAPASPPLARNAAQGLASGGRDKMRAAADPSAMEGSLAIDKGAAGRSSMEGPRVAPKPTLAALPCSDASKRPLAERIVLWTKRARTAASAEELIARYESAKAACELPDWRAESALLLQLATKVNTPAAASAFLSYFAGAPLTQRFAAHALLRRAVDPALVAEVRRALFGERIRWVEVDNQLAEIASPADRVAKLREVLAAQPGDPEGEVRLVRALAEADAADEARSMTRRLRDRGLVTPALAVELGDVLSQKSSPEDALRTYSEIVEFDAQSAASRRLLGDVCLRHGWYAPAYRQYQTLTELAPGDATAFLRLAAAAAGAGRVDEALRLQRQVASAEGTPGPADPRLWARLASAASLGRLLAAGTEHADGVGRKLKELQLWTGPATLQILTWDDYAVGLTLVPLEGDKEAMVGEPFDAQPVGLSARMLPTADAERVKWVVRWKTEPPKRSVRVTLVTIVGDGKSFRVQQKTETLAPQQKELALQ